MKVWVQSLIAVVSVCLMLCGLSNRALALEPVSVPIDVDAVDLTHSVDRYKGAGERLQVSTAPGPDGIVRRIEVRAREPGANPDWIVFALTNNSDEQLDRLLVAPHYLLGGSGLFWPDLGSTRVAAITPSQGFRPERQQSNDADVFLITLDPGATVTFVVELGNQRVPQLYLWEPDAYKDNINAFTLYRGIVLGISGLAALFLSILFVVKGTVMFPAAAGFAWAVLAWLAIDFGFVQKIFEITPADNRIYRALTEATLSGTLLVFLFAYLNLNRWHVRFSHATLGWLAGLVFLAILGTFEPGLTAGIARISFALTVFGGLGVIAYLATHGYDRAFMLIPTWVLLLFWVLAAMLVVVGVLNNDISASALAGGLVLIVLLIGFTIMQHAFAGGPVFQGLFSDVERKALAVTGAGDIIWDWDVQRDNIYASPEADKLLGLPTGTLEASPVDWLDLLHPEDRDRFRSTLDAIVEHRRGKIVEDFRLKSHDGHWMWVHLRARPIVGTDGEVLRCVGTLTDITASKNAEERMLHDSVHDHLTGLPNRELFFDRLEAAITRTRADGGARPSVLLIDIDRFKQVNESVGISVGDSILLTIARRLSRLLKPQDSLARVSGNQFAIVLISENEPDRIAAFADSLRRAIRAPVMFNNREIVLTASIGVAVWDQQYRRREDVFKDAEIAMYEAKRLGSDRIEAFKPAMRSGPSDRLTLETDLRHAIEREELKILYQPIVRLSDRVVFGFEALLRWDHPRHGRLAPREFISIAEETGLIVELGLFVLERTARQLSSWQQNSGGAPVFASVNISSRQLVRHDIIADIRAVLSRNEIVRGTLKLEVTESLVMENPEYVSQVLERVRELGAGLALDDFGTGYSSLSYLQRFPFDTIKVDKSFVQTNGRGKRSVLLKSIISMAHDLGMQVVAEGAETEDDARTLSSLGCEYAQGFAFGEPMTAEDARKYLTRQRPMIRPSF